MKRLSEALNNLDLALDRLEDTVVAQLAAAPAKPASKRKSTKAAKEAAAEDHSDLNALFTPDQLSTVKRRLDDAIDRLESALEVADGTH